MAYMPSYQNAAGYWEKQFGTSNPNNRIYGSTAYQQAYEAAQRAAAAQKSTNTAYEMAKAAGEKAANYLTNSSSGSKGGTGWSGGYIDQDILNQMEPGPEYDAAYNAWVQRQQALQDQISAMEEARRAAEAARLEAFNTSKASLNKASDEALRQTFIQKRMAERDLPQQLALQGATGGMTESSILGLNANYGENRTAIENERQQGLADLASQYQSGVAADSLQWETAIANLKQAQLDAELNYQMWLAEQAAQSAAKAASKSSTASKTTKPVLTLAQAEEAYNNGIMTENVINALKYYYGENPYENTSASALTSSASTSRNDAINQALDNYKRSGQSLQNWLSRSDVRVALQRAGIMDWFESYLANQARR